MSANKSKKSKSAKNSENPSSRPVTIGGTPKKDTSKLYAQMAMAPENKKALYQRLIDFIEK